jgi:hypothetical protein
MPNGTTAIPQDAPPAVQDAIAAGNRIVTTAYSNERHPHMLTTVMASYDCSGATDFVLDNAGLSSPQVDVGNGIAGDSTLLESYGDPGPGSSITIYASPAHAFVQIAGIILDTAWWAPVNPTTPASGPRWQPASILHAQLGDGNTWTQRHPPAYDAASTTTHRRLPARDRMRELQPPRHPAVDNTWTAAGGADHRHRPGTCRHAGRRAASRRSDRIAGNRTQHRRRVRGRLSALPDRDPARPPTTSPRAVGTGDRRSDRTSAHPAAPPPAARGRHRAARSDAPSMVEGCTLCFERSQHRAAITRTIRCRPGININRAWNQI